MAAAGSPRVQVVRSGAAAPREAGRSPSVVSKQVAQSPDCRTRAAPLTWNGQLILQTVLQRSPKGERDLCVMLFGLPMGISFSTSYKPWGVVRLSASNHFGAKSAVVALMATTINGTYRRSGWGYSGSRLRGRLGARRLRVRPVRISRGASRARCAEQGWFRRLAGADAFGRSGCQSHRHDHWRDPLLRVVWFPRHLGPGEVAAVHGHPA